MKAGIINLVKPFQFHKERIFFLFKIIIAGALIYYLVSTLRIDNVISSLKNADLTLIFLAVALLIPNIFLQFLKWKIFCNKFLNENNNGKIFTSLLIGLSGGILIPYSIGEYMGRNIPFNDKPAVDVTLSTFLDNICHLIVIIFFGSFSALFFIQSFYEVSFYLIVPITIILIVLFYLLFGLLTNTNFGNLIITKLGRFRLFKKYFIDSTVLYYFSKDIFIKITLLSVLLFFCYTFQFSLLLSAFSHQSNLLQFQWIGILVIFSKSVIPAISLGDLGIREGAAAFFASQIGLTSSIGFNASIFLFFINILFPAVIGAFLMLKRS